MSDLSAEAREFRVAHKFDELDPNTDGEKRQALIRQFIGGDLPDDTWKNIPPFTNRFLACILYTTHKKGLGSSDIVATMREIYAASPDAILRARAFYGLDIAAGWFERYLNVIETQYSDNMAQQRAGAK